MISYLASIKAINVWDINAKLLNAKCYYRNHDITSKEVCHLLYGLPGSGKTSTVDEICKLIAMRHVFKKRLFCLKTLFENLSQSNGPLCSCRIFRTQDNMGNWKFLQFKIDVTIWPSLPIWLWAKFNESYIE